MSLAPNAVTVRSARQLAPPPPRHYEDNEFLAPALEILETPPSPIRMAMITVICAFVAALLTWAYFGQIDMVATAQGKVQPTGRVKIVQPLENGKVSRILASNGSHVREGDVLVELDQTEAEAEVRAAQLALDSIRAEMARRSVAIAAAKSPDETGVPTIAWGGDVPAVLRQREERILTADVAQLGSNLAALSAQRLQKQTEHEQLIATMATQGQLIATLQQRVDMRNELIQHDAGTRTALIDATETLQYQLTQLAVQKGQLLSAERADAVLARQQEKARDDFASENAQKLGEAERQAEDYSQKLAKAQARLTQSFLRAPVAGLVQASAATNPGQVLTSGQEVMRIVPDGTALETEVYVQNRDIGFVKEGQDAVVKVEAFPFTRYGVIKAHVTHVAVDAIPQPEADRIEGDPARPSTAIGFAGAQRTQNLVFPVRLSLEVSAIDVDGQTVPLTSGMAVTVDLQTGRRRILEYLFSPMVEVASGAMRER